MVKLAVFAVVSFGITLFSWTFLRDRRTHEFYRYFAFETLLVLILANVDFWFSNPLGPLQLVSWVFLSLSLVLAVHGLHLLRVIGRPQGDFENTTQLVIVGAYKYIRHPLYASLLFGTWGVFLKDCTVLTVLLSAITSVFLYGTARVEESENRARFGSEYEQYMKSTRMFLPFIF